MRSTHLLRQRVKSATSSATPPGTPLQYCTSLIRRTDQDSIWPSFFFDKAEHKAAYFALKAFNIELATIDDGVSNPMVGRMRYQWWRDTMKRTFEHQPPNHPVAQLLHSLPQFSQLSSYHFTRLINAREAHFLNPQFQTLQDLADYSASTQSSLLYLLLQATSPGSANLVGGKPHAELFQHRGDEHTTQASESNSNSTGGSIPVDQVDDLTLDHAASHIAVTNTIATLLRSIPHHASKKINIIPAEIGARYDLKEEILFRQGPTTPGLRESVATLVGIAQAEYRTAQSCFDHVQARKLPDKARPVFLSATLARSWLERLSRESGDKAFDVFDARVHKKYWKLPFQVWSDARKGTL